MFSHEKLVVYQKALTCVAVLNQEARSWDRRHAVVDQLLRAAESILLNLVEGTRLHETAVRKHFIEYSLGSALECAACLDIGIVKALLADEAAFSDKQCLCEVVKMLTGLRRAWASDELHEPEGFYEIRPKLFAHERLEVYQVGLQFAAWLQAQPGGSALSGRPFRQLDKLATSVVLNIAESNGRYFAAERRKFLDTAQSSAVKAAAYVDLCLRTGGLEQTERNRGIELLGRAAQMLRAMGR